MTDQTQADIVERLRDWRKDISSAAGPEAATEIERLRAREAELQRKIDEAVRVIQRILPNNLGPVPDHVPDTFAFPCDMEAGEIREARAFLTTISGEA